MIGFNAIGRCAIGELAGGDDVVIFAPVVLDVTAALGGAPEVHGGGSALPPGTAVSIAVAAPLVAVGASVLAPTSIAVVVSNGSAFITHSATVTTPANDVVAASLPPSILGGASISASVGVTVTASSPFVAAGATILAPTANVNAVASSAQVSISATLATPAAAVAITSTPADILGGNYIEASNTVTMITPYGEIGSASIGEFAIGEGEPSSRTAKRGVLIRVGVEPPFISAGKSAFPPAANINISSMPAEIDSRLRRIRVYAIAS